MKILLIYPEFPETYWSFKRALRFISKKASLPPLGLLTVAAILPGGWEKRLVDMNVSTLTDRDLAWADYAFVGAMIVQRRSVKEVLDRCRKAGVPVVAGGPLFTAEPEKYGAVDHLVLGEAEITLPEFLRDLAAGHPQRVYAPSEFPDVRHTPAPLWELVDPRRYASMSVQYSRGCPFNCDFCNITTLFGHRPRTKTAEQIVGELEGLYVRGWRGNVFMVDDNLIGNKRELKAEILPALISWRAREKGFLFQTEVSINLADDDELVAQMVAAGFDAVFVGIETPDEASLTECHKVQNKGRDLVDCVKRLQRAGLQVQAGFIVGFDSDTASIFQRQIDFIQRSGIVSAMVGLLQAPRGTPLYARLQREGRLLDDSTGENTDGSLNFVPRMDVEALKAGYRHIMEEIYSPAAYYERIRTFLREYRPAGVRRPITMVELRAFLRSIYELGLRGAERVHYWSLFFWTLFRRPRLFPLAITLSIYGVHFRHILERTPAA